MQSIYFNEEHHQFRQHVAEFLQKEVDGPAWEKEKRIPKSIWRRMGELGYLGINFPEELGGSDADFFYSVAFLEEVGRTGLGGFAAAVGVQQYMATAHIQKFGSAELKQKYCGGSIRGELVGALAISEPDAGSDVAALRTRAHEDGDHFVINGSKTFITNGVYGDFVTVAVRTEEQPGTAGLSLLVVDADIPGFSARPLDKMGWYCSDTGELTFEDVRVPKSHLIGQAGMGFYYIMECFQLERLVAALTSNGGSLNCLDMTHAYIRKREAFGKSLSRYQVLRHRLVDLHTELTAARELTNHACWQHDRGLHAVDACSMAKLKSCELSIEIADACLQCFGGYGYMEEYPIARAYRDARVSTIVGGTSEIMREILAKTLIDGVTYKAPSSAGKSHKQPLQGSKP